MPRPASPRDPVRSPSSSRGWSRPSRIPTSGASASSRRRRCSPWTSSRERWTRACACATRAPTTCSSTPAARSSSTRSRFEVAPDTEPWPAYRQFCEHFLAPLALMSLRDPRCGLMLRDFIDGIPLDLAASLLPWRTRLSLGLSAHIHLHARAQRRAGGGVAPGESGAAAPTRRISSTGQRALLDSLRRTVAGLRFEPAGGWTDYACLHLVLGGGDGIEGRDRARDAGVHRWHGPPGTSVPTGVYSALATEAGYRVLAFDQDAGSVQAHWRHVRGHGRPGNPAPGARPGESLASARLGRSANDARSSSVANPTCSWRWRSSITSPSATTCRSRGSPSSSRASRRSAIVEFVPKEDPMTQRLLAARPDIFERYTIDGFRDAFGSRFTIARESPVADSPRTLFLLERREP